MASFWSWAFSPIVKTRAKIVNVVFIFLSLLVYGFISFLATIVSIVHFDFAQCESIDAIVSIVAIVILKNPRSLSGVEVALSLFRIFYFLLSFRNPGAF